LPFELRTLATPASVFDTNTLGLLLMYSHIRPYTNTFELCAPTHSVSKQAGKCTYKRSSKAQFNGRFTPRFGPADQMKTSSATV